MSEKLFSIDYDDYIFNALVIADSKEDAIKTLCSDDYYSHDEDSMLEMIDSITEISMDKNRVLHDTLMDN